MISEVVLRASNTEFIKGVNWLDYLNSQHVSNPESTRCAHTGLHIPHHYLVLPNGGVVNARDDRSHSDSGKLSVCLVGTLDRVTPEQSKALATLLQSLVSKYKINPSAIKGEGNDRGIGFTTSIVANLKGVPYGGSTPP